MMLHKARIFLLGESSKMEDVSAYIEGFDRTGPVEECLFEKIINAFTPQQAKSLGRSVPNYTDKVWFLHREDIVYYGNLLKFRQSEGIRAVMLKMVGKTFVEAAERDRVWGIGINIDAIDVSNPPLLSDWNGLNLLGKAMDRVFVQIEKEFCLR